MAPGTRSGYGAPSVIGQAGRTGLAGLLLEEAHQVTRVREAVCFGKFADTAPLEQQVVLYSLQQPLFQKMHGRDAELFDDGPVERHAAYTHHRGILLDALHVADMLLEQGLETKRIVVARQRHGQSVGGGIVAVESHQQIVEHRNDQVVAVGGRGAELPLDFLKQPEVFRKGLCRGVEPGRRIALVTVEQPVDEELVGEERAHEILAEDQKRVVELRLVHQPALLLVGREEQYHAVMQLDATSAEQQHAPGPAEEEELEEVGPEEWILGQYAANLFAATRIDVEADAALGLAERHGDQPSGICRCLHRSSPVYPGTKIRHSFIKMAYIDLFRA